MSLFKLHSAYQPSGDQPQAIKKLVAGIKKGYNYQTLLGVTGSGKTFTIANVIKEFSKPVLVIAPNKTLAAQLYREYKNFFPENSVNYFVSYYDYYQPEAYLPITDTYIEKEAMINEEIDRLRHQATTALLTRKDVIIVASVSCIYNLGVPLNYFSSSIHLEIDQPVTRGDFINQLVKIQFKRTNGVLKRGLFRVRGDTFEIMPASQNIIYRITLENQKVRKLELVDPVNLKIISQEKEIIVMPFKHFISTQPDIERAVKEIKKELKERLEFFKKNGKFLEAERLERRTKYDLEMLLTLGYCHGIENYSRHLTGKLSGEPPDTLLSYFPRKNGKGDFLTIIDESHIAVPQIRGMYEGDKSRKTILIEYGWRLPSALDNRPLKFSEFEKMIDQTIFTSATPGAWELKHSSQVVEQIIRPTGLVDPEIEIRPVFNSQTDKSQIDDVISEIRKITINNERAIVNTLTKKMAEDLNDYFKKQGIKSNYLHSDIQTLDRTKILTNFRRGKFNVLIGVNLLREGLDLPEVTLVAILDSDREGFLRSETSLIQTMGRAARNVKGKIILYADSITPSMKRAIDEVNRRRKKQLAYNKKHHITPQSITKNIEEFI
ncbi:MAG TPA: excinuclease ABC subunit UvrB [Candidatus Paceibacterota bacterium]|jgi:excinuclease ABC subunit B|nr:excinuclease ABC subunit UvrB [Candidatus Paceibacterota bacterium]HRS48037.1 excinuclease ABC subunit UvrB [Candidatus Paceibacterota bacterium]